MSYTFAQRHIGPREEDIKTMLSTLGVNTMEELVRQTVPENILLKEDLKMDAPMTENAYLAHLNEVRIVHGKGTGALRKGIHSYLKGLSIVREYHLAAFGEDDAGVTIVKFKNS